MPQPLTNVATFAQASDVVLPLHVDRPLTPADRARLYAAAFPKYPACWSDGGYLLGQWMLGREYQGSGYHGSYPPGFLRRVLSMFPEPRGRVLHLFSGSLPPGDYLRVDLRRDLHPDVIGDAAALPFQASSLDLILADPPYTGEDADKYGVAMVDRRKVFAECTRVLRPGATLVWLDMVHPMYRKRDLRLWGTIGITRSTNHRYRVLTMFSRR